MLRPIPVVAGRGEADLFPGRVRVKAEEGAGIVGDKSGCTYHLPGAGAVRPVQTDLPLRAESPGDNDETSGANGESPGASGETSPGENGETSAMERLGARRRAPDILIDDAIVEICRETFMSADDIAAAIRRAATTVRNRYLPRLVHDGRLELLHSDKLNHPGQAYRARAGVPTRTEEPQP